MDDLQKLFDNCKMLYKSCYNDVKAMASLIAESVKDIHLDPKITTLEFDIILQYSLLQIALADFDFNKNEAIFIRNLTDQGDIMEYLNSVAKTNFTWDDLYNTKETKIRELLRAANNLMEELSNEFVAVFAACDKITEYNYVADLEKDIIMIISSLALMDGEITKPEINEECLILGALNRIKDYKNQK